MDLITCAQGILRRLTNPVSPLFHSHHAKSQSPPAMPPRPQLPTMLILHHLPPQTSLTMFLDHPRNHLLPRLTTTPVDSLSTNYPSTTMITQPCLSPILHSMLFHMLRHSQALMKSPMCHPYRTASYGSLTALGCSDSGRTGSHCSDTQMAAITHGRQGKYLRDRGS
jgi:hypothetical protein